MRQNPVVVELAEQLSEPEVRMLNALEASWRILTAASEGLREDNAHNQADILDSLAEVLFDTAENISTEILEGGEEREGSELELSGQENEYCSLEDDFAMIYRDWIDFQRGVGNRDFGDGTDAQLAAVLRHAAHYHPSLHQPLKEDVTDLQLIAAAQDEYRERMRRGGDPDRGRA